MNGRQHLVLQERDFAVKKALSDYRYLSTSQLQTMIFGGGTFIYRRLKKMEDFGLIVRLQRDIIGEASELIHALTSEGARLLAEKTGAPASAFTVHRKGSRAFLEHQLALNEFRLGFEQAVKDNGDLSIDRWDTNPRLRVSEGKTLFPDGYVVLSTPHGRTHFFIELDRCTESVSRVFREKLVNYAAYHRSGRFAKEYRARTFRVLTITLNHHAMTTLQAASHGIAPAPMFWFTCQALVTPESILNAAIWRRADQPGNTTALYKNTETTE